MSATAPAPSGSPLGPEFFSRSVLDVAHDLVGCALLVDGVGGVIVETEAYRADEPACHAYVGLTPRTEPLFGAPGNAYVYLSYGVHSLLNAVAEPEGDAAAALIRAVEPRWGLDVMRARRGLDAERLLCAGPGRLTQALDVGLELNRHSLSAPPFRIHAPDRAWSAPTVGVAPRIGITRAEELPWRYCAEGSPYLSRPIPGAARAEAA
jgi:DNA-3-methyladenine glycosylase